MPRLNPNFQDTVFFLYRRNPQTGAIEGPRGSGVFVGMSGIGGKRVHRYMRHVYAISCWHVAVDDGSSILRVNTKDGASRFIECEPHEWEFIPGGNDLAAVDVTDRRTTKDEISCIPGSLFATEEFIAHDAVGIGEDGFMLGLFAEQPGERRNMVAARFGNISLLARSDAPVEQPNGRKHPAHIFDMRSRPGFSGSPVFIYRTPSGDLRQASERGGYPVPRARFSGPEFSDANDMLESMDEFREHMATRANTFLALLGIHAGQYHERVKAHKSRQTIAESGDLLRDGDALRIPSSMAVVVPAWGIMELMQIERFTDRRKQRELADDILAEKPPEPENEQMNAPFRN
jgi:hypothetical protein